MSTDLQIPLEIFSRLGFKINGFNYFVPSDRMLCKAMADMPDFASKERFRQWSNGRVADISQCFKGESMSQEIKAIRTLCILLGFEFNSLRRYWATTLYCDALFGNFFVVSRQLYDQAKVLNKKLPEFLETGNIQHRGKGWPVHWVDGVPDQPVSRKALAARFSEYRVAQTQWQAFWATVMQLRDEPLVQKFLKTLAHDNAKGSLSLFHQPLEGRTQPYQCKFCKGYFEFTRKRGQSKPPSHCESEQCQEAYERLKPSKQKRSIAAVGWVRQSKKRRCCKCRRQRILNSGQVCNPCFIETLSG